MSKSTVVLRGTEGSVRQAVRECMEALDWESVVPRDSTVVVKPNLCTAVPDKIEMSNADARVTEAVCELLLERTRRVFIGESDHLRNKAELAFENSGYVEMAKRLGIKLVNFTDSPHTAVGCGPAGNVNLPSMLLEADVFVSIPVLKTHALTYFTGVLKNQWGCVPQYDRILLHRYIHEMLPELHAIFKPRLSVMDAIVALEGRGPVSGRPRRLDLVLASADGVALDASAMRLAGLDPSLARHVRLAAERGLGNFDAADIEIDGDWARYSCRFEPAAMDPALSAMNYMSRYRWFVRYALEKDLVFYPVRAAVQLMRAVGLIQQFNPGATK